MLLAPCHHHPKTETLIANNYLDSMGHQVFALRAKATADLCTVVNSSCTHRTDPIQHPSFGFIGIAVFSSNNCKLEGEQASMV